MPQLNLVSRLAMFPLILLVLLVLLLQGCSSDSASVIPVEPLPDANPVGYYANDGFVDVMEADNVTQRMVTGFQGIAHDGTLMMLSDSEGLTYVGTIVVDENDFSGTVDLYEAGVMTQGDVPFSGTITEGTRITGTMNGTGAANGTFQLNYALDNGPVELSMVIHNLDWDHSINNPNSFTISVSAEPAPGANFSTGNPVGSGYLAGCNLLARMEPIPETHLYTVSGPMTDCNVNPATMDPTTYSGLVSVYGSAPDDRLVVMVSNGTYIVSGEYTRR